MRQFMSQSSNILPPSLNWLHNVAVGFSLRGEQVSILFKPEEFYSVLLERCRKAKHRVTLASLYLGTGHLEEKLVQTLEGRLKEQGQALRVTILLDALRSSRGQVNSRTMLLPLIDKHPHCQVSLFHTPRLRGLLRYLLPPRYNELVGLQHMKLYLFDNDVIISGANLSHDYFTNRQDRYILISDCQPLADFYSGLIERLSAVSLALDNQDSLTPRTSHLHPYLASRSMYEREARSSVWGFYEETMRLSHNKASSEGDTWVYPLLGLPPLAIDQDNSVTRKLLETAEPGASVHLATGYFNLTDEYTTSILDHSKACFRLLMAHPSANGFLAAAGLAGGIPGAYTEFAKLFLQRANTRASQQERISVFEYQRPGWTYHAKGLWLTPPQESKPLLTLIGSSNFGARSVERDLESQMVIVTNNEKLQDTLLTEQQQLYERGTIFTTEIAAQPDRKPALWVLAFIRFFKSYF